MLGSGLKSTESFRLYELSAIINNSLKTILQCVDNLINYFYTVTHLLRT